MATTELSDDPDGDVAIELNVHWLAVRTDNTFWTLYRKDTLGRYQIRECASGARRMIFELMERHEIVPTPKALEQLDLLPEVAGFPRDEDEVITH